MGVPTDSQGNVLSTFDIPGSPRRPGIDDVGGATKVDDLENPPDPVEQPTAAEWNEFAKQHVAIGAVVPVLAISVTFGNGTYTVASWACASTLPTGPTWTVTVNGTGDVSITWPAGTLPVPVASPIATVNGDVDASARAIPVANGVRVKMRQVGVTPATFIDAGFTVLVF